MLLEREDFEPKRFNFVFEMLFCIVWLSDSDEMLNGTDEEIASSEILCGFADAFDRCEDPNAKS